MPLTEQLKPTRDEARVAELLGRVEEKLGQIPQAYRTLALSQNFLNDTLYNLKRTMVDGELDLKTKHLIAIAVAAVAGGASAVEARAEEGRSDGLSDDEIAEALAVAGSIATYNIFYKFQHLAGDDYSEFRPGFKLSVFMRPSFLSLRQVELVCAIVSGINDCQSCVRGHLAKCRERGITVTQIEEALRVGAVVAGFAAFTRGE
jgi:alkyl hydroperoxide reductase subunit D